MASLLRGASEAERKACAKALKPLLNGPRSPYDNMAGGRSAVIRATGGFDSWWVESDAEIEAAVGVLADRRPPWAMADGPCAGQGGGDRAARDT